MSESRPPFEKSILFEESISKEYHQRIMDAVKSELKKNQSSQPELAERLRRLIFPALAVLGGAAGAIFAYRQVSTPPRLQSGLLALMDDVDGDDLSLALIDEDIDLALLEELDLIEEWNEEDQEG